MNKVRVAVIGVGSLGRHHARIVAAHSKAQLEFVVDIDEGLSQKIAKSCNCSYLTDYKLLLGKVDAVIISASTQYHYQIAKFFLENKISCLVEKPFTLTVEDAQELIEIAKKSNLILQVGHIERFNPAVIAALPFIKNPKFIEVNRLGPYDARTSHIGVILDLMVHDLDILFYLLKDKVISLEAHGAKILSPTEDIAKVRLKYANGAVADISASRISIDKYRKIRIFQPDAYISIDYAGKSVKIYRKKAGREKISSFLDIEAVKPKIPSQEPLFYEIDNFLNNIIEGKKPAAAGEQGRDAVELALNILNNLVF